MTLTTTDGADARTTHRGVGGHRARRAMAVLLAAALPAALPTIPASASTPTATAHVSLAAPRTTMAAIPLRFDTTDGDILAINRISGLRRPALAIGGNFHHVITPDGVAHRALNFAIVDERTGVLLYSGSANSYVRAIASYAGRVYVGGDFTSFGGARRVHAAALDARLRLMAWRPSPRQRVRALAADATGVYLAGDFSALWKIPLVTGRTLWTRPVLGGSGRALLVFQGAVYLGGLFETYAGIRRHGLVRIQPRTGSLLTGFNARLRADSGVGAHGAYDGEDVLALAARGRHQLLVGVGGQAAQPGLASNEATLLNAVTGARYWRQVLVGDCQAVAVAGATDVVGYHRNAPNSGVPWPNFAAQLNESRGALTSWDPRLTGTQSNADGGNNGVQAMLADPSVRTLFVAGAFTMWNGTPRQSLVAFRWS